MPAYGGIGPSATESREGQGMVSQGGEEPEGRELGKRARWNALGRLTMICDSRLVLLK